MPVIVIGADTASGTCVVERLTAPGREVRAFVSSPEVGDRLRRLGVKVALGDLSDQSHVAAACSNCFSAVLIAEAAADGRELSFAEGHEQVWEGWSEAIKEAGVRRAIWVGTDTHPTSGAPEEVSVASSPDLIAIANEVAALDEAAAL